MSRLIVKGLPSVYSEAKLRSVFEKYGQLTDCSLKYTKEGKFRRFAFVGYADEASAMQARNGLNNTFINASKIQVEECKPFGDEAKPRAWSKYAKDSSAYKRAHPDEENKTERSKTKIGTPVKKSKYQDDEKFKEFLLAQNMKPQLRDEGNSDEPNEKELLSELLEGITGDTSLSLILKDLPASIKQKSLKEWLSPIRVKGIKIARSAKEALAFVTFTQRSDVKKALQRNDQFIGGSKVRIIRVPGSEEASADATEAEHADNLYEDRQAENITITNAILETGRLFIRNLPYSCTEDDLRFLLKRFGEISDLQMIINKKTGACKGFAIVTYVFPENAVAAFSALDGTIFKGRMLHVLAGDEKRESKPEKIEGAKSAFQKEKAAKLKASAGKAHSWNALFLGANAVADTLAAKLNVEKSQLLSGEGETSAGVRLALAETRLVRETRDFLVTAGVCLDAFSRPAAKRSNTVIIVKNLPAGVELEELQRMFERHGPIKRALMPPQGISAIIEMANVVDARKAFAALAYSRFRAQPLYLEWAPFDLFKQGTDEEGSLEEKQPSSSIDNDNETVKGQSLEKETLSKEEKKKIRRSKRHGESEQQVKREYEEEMDKFRKQQINPSDPAKSLSMGFGFLKFYHARDAQTALKEMQAGILLDGHCLELKLSHREEAADESRKRKTVSRLEQGESTKIMVRNIPFQATRKEVKQLFATFGELRAFRMPKKMGSSAEGHRGFGFVDFLTRADARRAFDALVHSTHIYGRRLVLEWAKVEESIEELREKALSSLSGETKELRNQKKRMKEIEKDLTVIDDD
ncbi:putative RNA-binding protein 19 [Toxocara canis]|uniref:Putative RNA-binding protein 19 n=1 Tax=Toxocara canis TaxID=6265 RepID=A0A0B2VGA5_TOXCA|nr:putative RNA-binding protein 19 [Toxocara canis]